MRNQGKWYRMIGVWIIAAITLQGGTLWNPSVATPANATTFRRRTTDVTEMTLIPGGQCLGVSVMMNGLLYVGASDLGVTPSPARSAGLKAGDVIERIDDTPISSVEQLAAALASGERVQLLVKREGKARVVALTPALDPRDGRFKLGGWVRETAAGIGTLTFIQPQTGVYGALGHAITDPDTVTLLPVRTGAIYPGKVTEILPGEKGRPGELVGEFFSDIPAVGTIERNTHFGIFGTMVSSTLPAGLLYPNGIPVAGSREVQTGKAQLLTALDGEIVRPYDCEIVSIVHRNRSETRNLILHVTDPALLAQTGGIVQGMSGSPLIQNGKIIGAVTHVFVNDPTRGYGLLIENMLDVADDLDAAA